MSIVPITLCGDKILRKKTAVVTDIDDKIIGIITDMFDTMRNANGVGLAANQIGLNKQIFVADISPVEGYENFKPIVMINPKIISKSDETTSIEEGCLSIPELREEIIRPENVSVSFYDVDMKEHTIEADRLLARVIQHEYDHLKKHLEKIKKRKLDIEYPFSESNDYLIK
ncbi:MAG: peptide deformylase [Ignavibacteria bacterium CHB3]|nr:peptide deformylase [Ignavibacteria bacterium CHB3]